MKKLDKLKKQRYAISMKIIELESKPKLSKNEEKELQEVNNKLGALKKALQEAEKL